MTARGRHHRPSRYQSFVVTAIVVCLVMVSGYFRLRADRASSAPPARGLRSLERTSAAPSTPSSPKIIGVGPKTGRTTARPVSTPVHLTIASIGVSSALEPLTLLGDGSLQAPSQWAVAGWYSGGVLPGQVGPAVITGHVDSTRGPAVFYRLRDLSVGAKVLVTERAGTVLTFVVDRLQQFPKNRFPTEVVYGPQPVPELRLITCTGEFDPVAHSYLSNLVVTAHLA